MNIICMANSLELHFEFLAFHMPIERMNEYID